MFDLKLVDELAALKTGAKARQFEVAAS